MSDPKQNRDDNIVSQLEQAEAADTLIKSIRKLMAEHCDLGGCMTNNVILWVIHDLMADLVLSQPAMKEMLISVVSLHEEVVNAAHDAIQEHTRLVKDDLDDNCEDCTKPCTCTGSCIGLGKVDPDEDPEDEDPDDSSGQETIN